MARGRNPGLSLHANPSVFRANVFQYFYDNPEDTEKALKISDFLFKRFDYLKSLTEKLEGKVTLRHLCFGGVVIVLIDDTML